MPSGFEVVLPLSRTGSALAGTVDSLLAQTNKDFSILIACGPADSGVPQISAALAAFKSAGLSARCVDALLPLSEVEHWNWAHDQATGQWLKPVAPGDELAPECLGRLRAAARDYPSARSVFTNYFRGDASHGKDANFGWLDGLRSPADSRRHFLANGMPVGPLTTAAYQREAFMALGGLGRWGLPVAQQVLAAMLAMSFDTVGLQAPLCHPAQPDSGVSRSEMLAGTAAAGYHAWTEGATLSKIAMVQLIWRAARGRALEYCG